MRPTTIMLAALLTAPLIPATTFAQNSGQRNRETSSSSLQVTVGFSVGERQSIADYFTRHPYAVEALPPGIVKKLARGKPLPPGIAKRALPRDLVAALPVRDGFEISICGDRIVLLEASGLIVDILEGIF